MNKKHISSQADYLPNWYHWEDFNNFQMVSKAIISLLRLVVSETRFMCFCFRRMLILMFYLQKSKFRKETPYETFMYSKVLITF